MALHSQLYSCLQHFRNIRLTCYWHTFEILERTKQTFFCLYLPLFSKTCHEMFFHSDSESSLVLWERADAVNPVVEWNASSELVDLVFLSRGRCLCLQLFNDTNWVVYKPMTHDYKLKQNISFTSFSSPITPWQHLWASFLTTVSYPALVQELTSSLCCKARQVYL